MFYARLSNYKFAFADVFDSCMLCYDVDSVSVPR